MLSNVLSGSVLGIDAYLVDVEVDIVKGLPSFSTVGLPEGAVKESKDRVKSAIKNSGYKLTSNRITVNLAPADIKKEGTSFDLPIAVGIITALGMARPDKLTHYMLGGELSLDGGVRPIKGTLPMTVAAREGALRGVIIPEENSHEAAVVDGVDVIPVTSLSDVVEFLNGDREILPVRINLSDIFKNGNVYPVDFNEVKGQQHVKRSLEVSAAGGHNVLMVGPPGAGKTMLARRIPTILPETTFEEGIETTKVFSVMGLLKKGESLLTTRPFRAPHHTISDAGLIGGGTIPKPGEVSLAHNGVLFLDEIPEFRKNVLEVLRQPMEEGRVTISRAATSLTYPARFMLIAAMNPCPCGYLNDPNKDCSCTITQIQRYRSRVSGPLLDRIDIHIDVPAVRYKELSASERGESSRIIRERVNRARIVQQGRFKGKSVYSNAQMTPRLLKEYCQVGEESSRLLEMAIEHLGLSARAYTRILKVSRTIADLEGAEDILPAHISEAIQYRSFDRRQIV